MGHATDFCIAARQVVCLICTNTSFLRDDDLINGISMTAKNSTDDAPKIFFEMDEYGLKVLKQLRTTLTAMFGTLCVEDGTLGPNLRTLKDRPKHFLFVRMLFLPRQYSVIQGRVQRSRCHKKKTTRHPDIVLYISSRQNSRRNYA